ncbi:MAG: SPOR domain-containing protein, partial [Nitrospinota bacterium]
MAKARPAPKKRVAAVRTGRFTVQVGACRTAKCVRGLSAQLKKLGLSPYTKKSRNGRLTLVRLGSYPNWKQAKAAVARLKRNGFRDP